VPCGPIPPDPTELLLLDQVEILFARLRKQFDYIIIDTAPIGMVTDAMLLAHWADATLYLVRQGYTFKRQLEISKNLYLQKKAPKLNLIVNDTRTYRNYGYAYGYGNGNGYGHNDVVKNSITPHI
jgi:Mrp family chromosome partitioning ATPase